MDSTTDAQQVIELLKVVLARTKVAADRQAKTSGTGTGPPPNRQTEA